MMQLATFFQVEARREVARTLKRAIVRIGKHLMEKTERRGVAYHGKVINTHERYLRRKARR